MLKFIHVHLNFTTAPLRCAASLAIRSFSAHVYTCTRYRPIAVPSPPSGARKVFWHPRQTRPRFSLHVHN